MTVTEILQAAAATFAQRDPQYGSTWKRTGPLLLALFHGRIPEITTEEDARRLVLLVMLAGKLQRYGANFANGGHADSAHDAIVYAAMLESVTEEQAK